MWIYSLTNILVSKDEFGLCLWCSKLRIIPPVFSSVQEYQGPRIVLDNSMKDHPSKMMDKVVSQKWGFTISKPSRGWGLIVADGISGRCILYTSQVQQRILYSHPPKYLSMSCALAMNPSLQQWEKWVVAELYRKAEVWGYFWKEGRVDNTKSSKIFAKICSIKACEIRLQKSAQ